MKALAWRIFPWFSLVAPQVWIYLFSLDILDDQFRNLPAPQLLRAQRAVQKIKQEAGTCHDTEKLFLASVRISKTGSTSLENALHNAFDYVHRLPRFFSPGAAPENTLADAKSDSLYHIDGCFYGFDNSTSKNDSMKPHQKEGNCHHRHYRHILRQFQQRRPFLQLNKPPDNNENARLQAFTVIRDPFEHLASFFYYSRSIHPWWEDEHTERQNECVEKGDFKRWLELLHEEGSPSFSIPNQYGQLVYGENLTEALGLISSTEDGNQLNSVNGKVLPEVIVLINECMETSVRLLEDLVPQIFHGDKAIGCNDAGGGGIFRDTQVVRKRERFLEDNYGFDRSTAEKKASKEKNVTQWKALREQAKVWFPDDFSFYRASIQQYQKYLENSNIGEHHVNECNERLRKISEAL